MSSASTWRSKFKIVVIFPYLLLVFGLVGVAASVTINIEKVDLIRHPKTELACDLNPIYACGNVIDTKQSKTLGVPNELTGIAIFSVITCVGVMMLAGSQPKKWFWMLFMAGMLAFSLATFYLWYQSVYVIESLCIFCSTVWFSGWAVTMGLFTWLYDNKLLILKHKKITELFGIVRRYSFVTWLGVILLLVALTLKHFWYYYGPSFGF